MLHKGRLPYKILEFLMRNPHTVYTPKRLSEELCDPRVDSIRRTLNRLVRRGLIKRVSRGKFKYPLESGSVISDVKMIALVDKIITLLMKDCRIPDNVKNREILMEKIKEALLEIKWR